MLLSTAATFQHYSLRFLTTHKHMQGNQLSIFVCFHLTIMVIRGCSKAVTTETMQTGVGVQSLGGSILNDRTFMSSEGDMTWSIWLMQPTQVMAHNLEYKRGLKKVVFEETYWPSFFLNWLKCRSSRPWRKLLLQSGDRCRLLKIIFKHCQNNSAVSVNESLTFSPALQFTII